MKTLRELMENAVILQNGKSYEVCWPQFEKMDSYTPTITMKDEKTFWSNNGIIAFVYDNNLFVIPSYEHAFEILLEEGFTEKCMYVPFSNSNYPRNKKVYWEQLKELAKNERIKVYEEKCQDYCKKNNIKAISTARCFKIPSAGVKVIHPLYVDTYYPHLHKSTLFGNDERTYLGSYYTNNGTIVFINTDGNTYVTRHHDVLVDLINSGFKEVAQFVPFSNGEIIKDFSLAREWNCCR